MKKFAGCWRFSERERHCKVLLTSKNLSDMRRNPTPYSLPIILCPLPLEIIDGENFFTVDLLCLISDDALTSGGVRAEIADQRPAAPSPSGPPAPNSEGSSSAHPASRRGIGGSRLEHLPLPSRGGKSTRRILKVKKKKETERGNAPRTQVSDFIPWVPPGSSQPSNSEEGEEEEMMGLVNRYAARKQKRQENVEQRPEAVADQADGSSQPSTGSSSEVQAIIILGSPETGSNDRLDIGENVSRESGVVALISPTLQIIPPSAQVRSQSGRSEFTRTGLKRPSLPDWILMNSYLPTCGSAPPKEEVSAPGLEDVKHIVCR